MAILALGDRLWSVEMDGWDRPLRVFGAAGEGCLQPWTLDDHLRALAQCAVGGASAPGVDAAQLAGIVLDRCWSGPPADGAEDLALWWATAPEAPSADGAGWLRFGRGRARLRAWSWLERGRALAAVVRGEALDTVGLLAAELVACIAEIEPEQAWGGLPAGPVLAGLLAVNEPPALPAGLAGATLRASRALGWTPRQVLDAPAVEMDLLLTLLDEGEPRAPGAASSGGLAAHPDTVTIVFGGA